MDFNWQHGLWRSFSGGNRGDGELHKQHPSEKTEIEKGLSAITSSLSRIGDILGTALEEGFHGLTVSDHARSNSEGNVDAEAEQRRRNLDNQTQLKASRDVAVAMSAKVKLLLRELKTVKSNLAFTKQRCSQLEEENARLRESLEKGIRHEDDDLVRKQLEALVLEKSRLSQENANYARENQLLHEVIEYRSLSFSSLDDEQNSAESCRNAV